MHNLTQTALQWPDCRWKWIFLLFFCLWMSPSDIFQAARVWTKVNHPQFWLFGHPALIDTIQLENLDICFRIPSNKSTGIVPSILSRPLAFVLGYLRSPCIIWPNMHYLVQMAAGLGTCSFPFRTFRSFPFFKRTQRSFPLFFEFLATYETQKNVSFFSKERKRTQRMQHTFAKNVRTFRSFAKECRTFRSFFNRYI